MKKFRGDLITLGSFLLGIVGLVVYWALDLDKSWGLLLILPGLIGIVAGLIISLKDDK